MSETDKRPPRQRATITIDVEDSEIVVKGKWHDSSGKKHDLGFARLPTWEQAETMAASMAKRLAKLASK